MKKKTLRPINLRRETLRRLDESPLKGAAGGSTTGHACTIWLTRPTVGYTCGGGATGGHGPREQ